MAMRTQSATDLTNYFGAMKMIKRILGIGLATALLALSLGTFAQPQGTVFTIEPSRSITARTLTNVTPTVASYVSADQVGNGVKTVTCFFNSSSFTGSLSAIFGIQNKDPVSGIYQNLITSAAITSLNSATAIAAGHGLPTTANVSIGFPISTLWRVSSTLTGAATQVTVATISCIVAN